MDTVYTAPNGTADVVRLPDGRYRARYKLANGGWMPAWRAFDREDIPRKHAYETDRFRPDGSGRF